VKYLFLIILFAVAGCSSVQVRPITSSVPLNMDLQKVESAITRGANDRDWVAKKMGANLMELSLDTRGHHLVVNIKYDTASYSIVYKDSTYMKYDPSRNTIHGKYQKWVSNLRQAIDKYLRN
jgi:predicted fused transcriptional regulator/phosphomethylpyrimidine kinase